MDEATEELVATFVLLRPEHQEQVAWLARELLEWEVRELTSESL